MKRAGQELDSLNLDIMWEVWEVYFIKNQYDGYDWSAVMLMIEEEILGNWQAKRNTPPRVSRPIPFGQTKRRDSQLNGNSLIGHGNIKSKLQG